MAALGCKADDWERVADSLEQASRSAKIERLFFSKAVIQRAENPRVSTAAIGQ